MAGLLVTVASEANLGLLLPLGNMGESRFLCLDLRSVLIRAACFSAPADVPWYFLLFSRSRSFARFSPHSLQ
jgi:hypothetical protein